MAEKLVSREFDICPTCNGSGEQPYSTGEWIMGILSFGILFGKKSPCTTCEGRGHIIEEIYEEDNETKL